MKKKMLNLCFTGFLSGVSIGFIIALFISICIGDGYFYPVAPKLITQIGNELNAVIIQTVFCGLMGAGFSMASVIWKFDSWSLAKQSGVYFTIACLIMFPISYIANWMEHSLVGVISYFIIFVIIFLIIWIIQYLLWKIKIKKVDDYIKKNNNIKK